MTRFTIEHPPGPGDAVYDDLTGEDGETFVRMLPLGGRPSRAEAFVDGARYECDRITDALWTLAETSALDEDGEVLRTVDVLALLGADAVAEWRKRAKLCQICETPTLSTTVIAACTTPRLIRWPDGEPFPATRPSIELREVCDFHALLAAIRFESAFAGPPRALSLAGKLRAEEERLWRT